MNLNTQLISNICQARIFGNNHLAINRIIIDSRMSLPPYQQILFVCIRGKRFDGHQFVGELYKTGVRAFLIEQELEYYEPDATYIKVESTINALQAIAAHHRKQFNIPVIGITGSYGKSIIKEWLYDMLESNFSIIRSPKSFNSQIGVPLSVLQLNENHNLAIFEAGISQPNEMNKLKNIIQPTIGIFTNIGKAHQENFENIEHKIQEKLVLFEQVEVAIIPSKYTTVIEYFKKLFPCKKLITWGYSDENHLQIQCKQLINNEVHIKCSYLNKIEYTFRIPFNQDAFVENALTAATTAIFLGIEKKTIEDKIQQLKPLEMRLEMVDAINRSTLINDYYNSDLTSVSVALQFLQKHNNHPRTAIILSDIPNTGMPPALIYSYVGQWIKDSKPDVFVGIGSEITQNKSFFPSNSYFYESTNEFLNNLYQIKLYDATILLKGARKFTFEKIRRALEKQTHETVVVVDLNALRHNFLTYKSLLPKQTGMIAMVKAFSYGSGLLEIARLLQDQHIDYLGVAFADEGIELRNHGIHVPVMVMSPENFSFLSMIEHRLEPVIYNFRTLMQYAEISKKTGFEQLPFHIKIDSGMHRLGFTPNDVPQLLHLLKKFPWLKLTSVFTHLAASDDQHEDAFTIQQIKSYQQCLSLIRKEFSHHILSHVQNSAGIERFHQYSFDLARIGIGLYGFSQTSELKQKLQSVLTFKTSISQIKTLKKGDTVGYNRKGIMKNNGRIAILPIGYADGFNRKLGNGAFEVKVHNQFAPTIGTVCMDMCMIDISHIPSANEGDEVIIFENTEDIERMAKVLNTIPYEILTSISRRVKRIYYHD